MMQHAPRQGPKRVAVGEKAMVSSSHPAVTAVMLDVIRDGGNAVDAAVAGSLVQPVYEVHMTNHAGTVAFLHWNASSGRSYFMDACAELPRGLKPFTPNPYAPSSAACIPGFIPGLAEMLERFGTKSWNELCEPAVKAAREGVTVTPWQYGYLHQTLAYRTYYPSGREFFTPKGFLTNSGEMWRTPPLAKTLEILMAEGPEHFTKGGWAKKFVEEGNRLGWEVRLEDVAAYKPQWLQPLSFKHGEDTIVGMPPPQRGGLYTALILGILSHFNLREGGHYTVSADSLKLIAWALARAHGERSLMHDPEFYDVPVDVLLSNNYHRQLAVLYLGMKPKIDLSPWMRLNLSKSALYAGLPGVERNPHDSCELSVVDPQATGCR
jgi:gamma-glutamyltranspeptidase/glutathione hydrolase